MNIHEDADGATIANETIAAVRECARMVGKIGPRFTAEELSEMEEMAGRLVRAIELKRHMINA